MTSGPTSIGECSWCGEKPVAVITAPRDTKICAVCIKLCDEIHQSAIPKEQRAEEMKRRLLQAAGHRVRRFVIRMSTLGQRAEVTAWTWLDAKLEQNRQRLASDYWRKRKWWVVLDGTTVTGYSSRLSAKEASGGKEVRQAAFAEEAHDGKIDPLAAVMGAMGLAGILATGLFRRGKK